MIKVLLINTPVLHNRGSMAVVIGAINCLFESIPNAQVTILCHRFETDKNEYTRILGERSIQVRQHPCVKQYNNRISTIFHTVILATLYLFYSILCRILSALRLNAKNIFLEHEVIIDLSVDMLRDDSGVFAPLFTMFNMVLGLIAGKPIVVWATSIVPFKNRLIERIAKTILNGARLITLREEASKAYLKNIGVDRPQIYVTADFAFSLKPAPPTQMVPIFQQMDIQEFGKPIVGITPLPALNRYTFTLEDYTSILADITDTLAENIGATIIYIPHRFGDTTWNGAEPMGAFASEKIFEKVRQKACMKSIRTNLLADELKAVIGRCDIFISFMLHPLIASMSSCVPSIAIVTYNPFKFRNVMSMMGQEECIIEVNMYNKEDIKNLIMAKLDYVLINRENIRKVLTEKAKLMEERAKFNGSLLKTLVSSIHEIEFVK